MKKRFFGHVLRSKQAVTTTAFAALIALGGSNASAQLDPNAFTSLGTLTANGGDTVAIDTTAGTITINGTTTFTGVSQSQAGAGTLNVFAFSNINIASGATVTVTGTNALALLSQGNASVLSTINASGAAGNSTLGSTVPGTAILGGGNGGAGNANNVGGAPGAAQNGTSTFNSNGGTAVSNPNPATGSQDGAGGGNGGSGANGGSANGTFATGGAATGVSPTTTLVGGGGGSGGPYNQFTGNGAQPGAGGGAGGGAIEIVASGNLTVSSLTSNGGQGGGVQPGTSGQQYGGGGAGGTLVLSGQTLTVNGALNASGGSSVTFTGAGGGGGGAISLLGAPTWVLGSSNALTGLGISVTANAGASSFASANAGAITASTLGLTAPAGQTVTFNGTNFTNTITPIAQSSTTPSLNVSIAGTNLVLDGGTLQFTGANQTLGPTSTFNVTSNSGIVDTQGFNDTISSAITGSGAIFKTGTGSLTLTNNSNVASGGVGINQGTVIVAGTSALGTGGVTQVAGTTLQTDNVNHTIGIATGYNMTGGNLVINLNGAPGAASNDKVNVTGGGATLNGNLTINYNAGPIAPGTTETYTVVTTTGGVTTSGTGFTNPTLNSGALILTATGAVANGGNDFDISIMASQGLFRTIGGLTPNQYSTATYIDRVNASGSTNPGLSALVTALDAVSTDVAALGAALNQLMPLNFAHFASSTAFNATDFLTEQMDNYFAGHRSANGSFVASNGHLDYSGLTVNDPNVGQGLQQIRSRLLAWNPAPSTGLINDSTPSLLGGVDMKDTKALVSGPANLWNVFVAGDVVLGQDFSDNYTGNAHDDSTSGEVRIGADYAITPNFLVGVLFNYSHTDATLDAQNSKATIDGYMPGLYASYSKEGWYANAIGTYSFNSYTQNRNVSFAGFSGRADSAPTGGQILGNLDGGYDFHDGNLTFGPTAGLKYIHLDVNGYTENGLPGADLVVNRDEADSLRSRLGARVSYVFHDGGLDFTPHLDVSWIHEFMDSSRGINSQFTGQGVGTFSVSTASPSRDSALVNLGLDARIDDTITVFGNYSVEAGQDNYFGQSVQAGVKIGF